MTISGHFFANYIKIFHKTEVLMVILMCLLGLNLNRKEPGLFGQSNTRGGDNFKLLILDLQLHNLLHDFVS